MPKADQQSALSERAYEYILKKILRRELLPGEILNRRTIADELQISIAPVLEALVRLDAEGLLTTIPRKGTQIRLIRAEEIAEQMVVREALECEAARYYCGEPIVTYEERLLKLADAVDNHRSGDPISCWKVELEFHRALIELSGCRSLLDAFSHAMHLGTLCATEMLAQAREQTPIRNHRYLVKKLKTENPDEAESFIRDHLRSGKQFSFQRLPLEDLQKRLKNGRASASR